MWRSLFSDVQIQRFLTSASSLTLAKASEACCKAEVITNPAHRHFIELINSKENSDITEVFKLYHHKFASETAPYGQVNLRNALRFAAQNKRVDDWQSVEFLNFRFREILNLQAMILFARNVAIHDFSDKTFAWEVTVFSSIVRFSEIAVMPRDTKTMKLIDRLRENLPGNTNLSDGGSAESSDEMGILNKLDELQKSLNLVLSNIDADKEIDEVVPQKSADSDESIVEVEDEFMSAELSYQTNLITAEQLRIKLSEIKSKIEENYQTHISWTGVSSNILKSSNAASLLKNQFSSIEELLAHGQISEDFGRRKEIMQLQVEQFGNEINELLAKTVWE